MFSQSFVQPLSVQELNVSSVILKRLNCLKSAVEEAQQCLNTEQGSKLFLLVLMLLLSKRKKRGFIRLCAWVPLELQRVILVRVVYHHPSCLCLLTLEEQRKSSDCGKEINSAWFSILDAY